MEFVNSFKDQLFKIKDFNFNEKALELFRFQSVTNQIYNKYLNSLKVTPGNVSKISDIPFLPISFFKSHKVLSYQSEPAICFESSGTTGQSRSKHYISDIEIYNKLSKIIFEEKYTRLDNTVILALLPSYLENPNSSLIHMIKSFMKITGSKLSGFIDFKTDFQKIKSEAENCNRKIFLFGVSYALLDLADNREDLNGVTVIETGGMKGRKKELTRNELHQLLMSGLNLPEVHSEYGMTELISQAYSSEKGIFDCPYTMKVFTREQSDPFMENTGERTGILKVIDLANIHSCAFIETEDLGFVHSDGKFEVLGRMDNSEIRGCSLMYHS